MDVGLWWGFATVQMFLLHGGVVFCQAVVDRHIGREEKNKEIGHLEDVGFSTSCGWFGVLSFLSAKYSTGGGFLGRDCDFDDEWVGLC